MAKLTLLEMVQNILSAMDSDEVNSIFDTVESQQVVEVIKETYDEQFNNITIPEMVGIVTLESVSDVTRPNYLKFPSNTKSIEWLRYRGADERYTELTYCDPEDFFKMVLENTATGSNTMLITDSSGVQYYIKTNRTPHYYTVSDDNFLIFDSYDASWDTTLQSSKTFAWGTKEPVWEMQDDFIPLLDSNLFPLLLSEAKSTCFINFKQISSTKEEQRARRQRIRMQNNKWKAKDATKRTGDRTNYARYR